MSKHETVKRHGEIFFALCKGVDSPISLGAWMRYYSGEHQQLTGMHLRPADYDTADRFQQDYAVVSYFKKFEGLRTGVDLEAVALEKLEASEAHCAAVNRRLKGTQSPFLEAVISTASWEIGRMLGPLNKQRVLELCRWGPGATENLRRVDARFDKKIKTLPVHCSRLALPYLRSIMDGDIHWARCFGIQPEGPFSFCPSVYEVMDENRVITVPKDARSDRVISAEPTGNTLLQQGVGRFLRRTLRRLGVDLNDQRINQGWASLAHQLHLSTLDLSSASDTIARSLVAILLPLDWFIFLDELRTPFSRYPNGDVKYNERFASMGNAYIFELETLIFLCLTRAAIRVSGGGEEVCTAYGDDIICPSTYAAPVVEALTGVGFIVNHEKSYTSGAFYESCGRHYFHGVDVTPCYQKRKIIGSGELIRAYNRLYRAALRSGFGTLDPRYNGALCTIQRASGKCWDKFQQPEDSVSDDAFLVADSSTSHRLVVESEEVCVDQEAAYAWYLRRGRIARPPLWGNSGRYFSGSSWEGLFEPPGDVLSSVTESKDTYKSLSISPSAVKRRDDRRWETAMKGGGVDYTAPDGEPREYAQPMCVPSCSGSAGS